MDVETLKMYAAVIIEFLLGVTLVAGVVMKMTGYGDVSYFLLIFLAGLALGADRVRRALSVAKK